MFKRLVCLLGCLSLFGCASLQETAESPETFAACKTVDIATTAAIINQGGHEMNPIAKVLIGHSYIPLIAVSIAIYMILVEVSDPEITTVANAVTCPVAAHNLGVLLL